MFTGLIETLGTVISVEKNRGAALFGIRPEAAGFSPKTGASVAIDGVCLTIEQVKGGILYFTAVAETLSRTTLGRAVPQARVNLEQAMQAGGRFDGHMVLGHVDGIGTIVADRTQGRGILRTVRVPEHCLPLVAEKGSVAIDGISLTIAGVSSDEITIALIPATLGATTMSRKREGDTVNIECDVLVRYLYRMLKYGKDPANEQSRMQEGSETILQHMKRAGF
jgi:riboflavin synthase